MKFFAGWAGLAGVTIALLALLACVPKPPLEGPFVDPQFFNLIPADTTLLLGISVERLVKTPVYQKYLIGVPIPAIEQFGARTGINPEKNLWQLLFVSNGKDGFWLGRGKFADEFLAPDFSQPGIKRFTYGGYTFFGNEQKALVVFNASTAGIGETRVMRALVDQHLSVSAPPAKITALLKTLPHDVEAWGVWSGGPVDFNLPGNLNNSTRILQSLESATMYLALTTKVHGIVSGTAVSDAAAEDVHGALSSLLALAQAMPQNQSLANGVSLSRQARQITIKLDAAPELLGLLLR